MLNGWIGVAVTAGVPVYASRDWHPPGHVSFAAQGGPWPEHCVQDTPGASFHPALGLPADAVRIVKGARLDRDQYSAFDDTGLAQHMRARGVRRVWVGGLAADVCVHATALDARRAGFEVHLIMQATRAVSAEGGHKAMAELDAAGVVFEP